MRLHLSIHRNGLPSTTILWTVGGLGSSSSRSNAASTTISQLLEQINDVIPLESGDWGLEDYVLQCDGFECLHFQEVTAVLKDEDTVQHLIDGVPFGRPFFRPAADRPVVTIPSRKRKRLTYREIADDVVDGTSADRQVVVRADFEDTAGEDDDDDDEDFEPGNVSGSGDEEEEAERSLVLHQPEEQLDHRVSSTERATAPERQELAEELARLSPAENETGSPLRSKKRRKRTGGSSAVDVTTTRSVTDKQQPTQSTEAPGPDSNGSPSSPKRQQSPLAALLTSPARSRHVRFHDVPHDGSNVSVSSEGDITSSSDEDEDIEDETSDFEDDGATSSEETGQSGSSTDSEDEDETSDESSGSSNTSDDEGEEDEEQENATAEAAKEASAAKEEGKKSRPKVKSSVDNRNTHDIKNKKPSVTSPKSHDNDPVTVSKLYPPREFFPVPHAGSPRTRARNQRRREMKTLRRWKTSGKMPPNATLHDLRDYLDGEGPIYEAEQQINPTPRALSDRALVRRAAKTAQKIANFEERRSALLESLAAGGIEINQDGSSSSVDITAKMASLDDEQTRGETSSSPLPAKPPAPVVAASEQTVQGEPEKPADAAQESTPTPPSRPRKRVDVASSRRMVFGSLGLKTPKTKADEDKLRDELKKQARPAPTPRTNIHLRFDGTNDSKVSADGLAYPADENPDIRVGAVQEVNDDSWHDKIDLTAVECVDEGVKLSAPPFPFVQRWDPQQQARAKRQAKKRKRNRSQHYEDEDQYQYDNSAWRDEDGSAHVSLNYDETSGRPSKLIRHSSSDRINGAVNEQIIREANDGANDVGSKSAPEEVGPDIPAMPDPSICTDLAQTDLKPGMVIGFKRLIIGADWQPILSDYQTAVVDETEIDGTVRVTLAKRDRAGKAKSYNETTGERVYGKFEMPEDGNDDDDDDGILELSFAEMSEPKLVVAAPESTKGPRIQDIISEDAEVPQAAGGEDIGAPAEAGGGPRGHDVQGELNPENQSDQSDQSVPQQPLTLQDSTDIAYANVDGNRSTKAATTSPLAELTTNVAHELERLSDPGSPVFNGLSSSPPATADEPLPTTTRLANTHSSVSIRTGDVEAGHSTDSMTLEKEPSPVQVAKAVIEVAQQLPSTSVDHNFETRSDAPPRLRDQPPVTKLTKLNGNAASSDSELPDLEVIISSARSVSRSVASPGREKATSRVDSSRHGLRKSSPISSDKTAQTNGATRSSQQIDILGGSEVFDLTQSSDGMTGSAAGEGEIDWIGSTGRTRVSAAAKSSKKASSTRRGRGRGRSRLVGV
ncbi:MAG: hypothetical protein M1817_000217 [Caeruleum heppii]|nr:MAG: hypothetical protein M1817_000217 [Caeruleum heppii]